MQYDLKDIAERVARIRGLERDIYDRIYRMSLTELGMLHVKVALELGVVADLLPKVEK